MNDESLSEPGSLLPSLGSSCPTAGPAEAPDGAEVQGTSRPGSESDEEAHPGYYGNGLLTRPQIDYLAWLFTDGLYKPPDW